MATYAQIVQKLQNWMEDTGTDLGTAIPQAIADAEAMIARDLNVDQMRFNTALALIAGTYVYTKPVAALAIRQITYTTAAGAVVTLEYRRHEYIIDYAPTPGVLADRKAPKFWDNYDQLNTTTGLVTAQIYIGPTPALSYTGNIEGEGAIAGLTSTNTTTYLSVYKPDFLFAACIKKAAKFQHDSPMIAEWDKTYGELLVGMQGEVVRSRGDATSTYRVQ